MTIQVLEELRKLQIMMKEIIGTMIAQHELGRQENSSEVISRVIHLEMEVKKQSEIIGTLQRQMQASIDCHLRGREALGTLTDAIKKMANPNN